MKVQNISGYNTASFKGLKEIQGIEKKYAKGEQDKKLVEKALYANTAEMDITSDGVFVEKNDAEKIDSFLTAAQKAAPEEIPDKMPFSFARYFVHS